MDSRTPRTLEQRIDEWLKQPGTFVTEHERRFILDMRSAAMNHVGYGWMQQITEWEWQSKGIGAFGPEYFSRELAAAERLIKNLAPTGRYNGLDIEQWCLRAEAAEARARETEKLLFLCRPQVAARVKQFPLLLTFADLLKQIDAALARGEQEGEK